MSREELPNHGARFEVGNAIARPTTGAAVLVFGPAVAHACHSAELHFGASGASLVPDARGRALVVDLRGRAAATIAIRPAGHVGLSARIPHGRIRSAVHIEYRNGARRCPIPVGRPRTWSRTGGHPLHSSGCPRNRFTELFRAALEPVLEAASFLGHPLRTIWARREPLSP
jgi:hypothetical protein